jgi:uncharacterized membrane protein YedE/YeeE
MRSRAHVLPALFALACGGESLAPLGEPSAVLRWPSEGEPAYALLPHHWAWAIASGLLVGAGTQIGSGCTSGHGVCGLANLSTRSLVATVVFMTAAVVTVFVVRHGGVQ